jgi:hypothetical protein
MAFERIGQMALDAGKIVEISVYGGSALILTLNQHPATRCGRRIRTRPGVHPARWRTGGRGVWMATRLAE